MSFYYIFILSALFSCLPKEKADHEQVIKIDRENHSKKEVVIFAYHRFGNSKYPSTNISLENFDKHLSHLKKSNFKILTFGEAVDYINNAETDYSEKVACITIDDGYSTFRSNAMPILKKFGFKATLFINSESVGGGSYMDWRELKEV